jgi:tripartite-type tricarboxylate transporter receptor subunit TctC
MKRLRAVLIVIAGACLSVAPAAAQSPSPSQAWPTRPVRIVNTFAPGGAADVLARTVADGLSSAFGQPFYVETRAGAAGAIGVQSVAATPPDGIISSSPTSRSWCWRRSAIRSSAARCAISLNIAYIAGSPIVLSVNPASGVKTLDQFIAYAKKSAKPLPYSSSGVGSMGQLFTESFAQRAGIAVEHVPYKGAAQGLLDLIGGHIAFAAQTVGSTAGQIRGGGLTGIAQSASMRLQDFPDLPTFKELGYPDLVSTTWFSLSGPAGLPAEIVQKVNREIAKTMARRRRAAHARGGDDHRGAHAGGFWQIDRGRDRPLEARHRACRIDREVDRRSGGQTSRSCGFILRRPGAAFLRPRGSFSRRPGARPAGDPDRDKPPASYRGSGAG